MIQVLHWLSCFVVLSVALAQLEAIRITSTRVAVRALGWTLLGLDAFSGVIAPFFDIGTNYKIGMIGIAVLAISYQWQGATKHVRSRGQ